MVKIREMTAHEQKDYPGAVAMIVTGRHEYPLTKDDIRYLGSKLINHFQAFLTLNGQLDISIDQAIKNREDFLNKYLKDL